MIFSNGDNTFRVLYDISFRIPDSPAVCKRLRPFAVFVRAFFLFVQVRWRAPAA